MSAESPQLNASSLVTFTIKVAGKAIGSDIEVESIDTWTAVNKVPRARLVIFDGNPATSDFVLSGTKTFLPGNQVEIAAGYESKETTIFKGVIVKQGLEISQAQASKMIVDLSDESLKMSLERKNALFENIKDSDLIGKLIAANGLQKAVEATNTVHEQVVQYYATDWDLMLMRAEMNGFVVMAEAGKITVKTPDTSQAPVLSVKYGDSILDLGAEMDAATQVTSAGVKSYTWDVATQKLIESGPGAVNVKEQGNVSSAELAKVFNQKQTQQTGASIEKTALQDWSSAELLKSKLSKIRGWVRFQGSAKAVVGKTIELAGLGPRFNGTAFLSGVRHHIENGAWLTTADFGLSAQWFAAEAPDIAAPDASMQMPPVKGLQTGIVKKIAKDPDGEFRVFVNLPLLQDNAKGLWVRLGTFYASNKVGAFFFPEVNDEVIVGFMNEDPRYGVILGSVYSKKLAPPYPPDEQNTKKALMTKGKLEIYFDDKDKIIEIRTPGKHLIKMDDKSGAISIQDSNKNTVSLSKGGIALDSGSNIKITAKGNINIAANGNLALSAKANATMEGLQVEHKAQAKFAARGNAQAEVVASGILTVRGALVKIN